MADYANPDSLVTTDWVAQHLNDPKVRLIEVDVDTAAYDTGHAPGAVGWNWKSDLETHVVRDVADKEGIEKLLSQAGVDKDTTIVLSGDNNNWFAAYALWLLKYYGVDNVKLMNGGRKKWMSKSASRSSPTRRAPSHKSRSLRAEDDPRLYVTTSSRLRQEGRRWTSARRMSSPASSSPRTCRRKAQRGGHIPGAKNIPWGQAVNEDGTFKSRAELEQLYGAQGITPDKDIIAYCRIGERSAHTWFVLTHLLGYPNVRNYDGSWTEWGSLVGAPIER